MTKKIIISILAMFFLFLLSSCFLLPESYFQLIITNNSDQPIKILDIGKGFTKLKAEENIELAPGEEYSIKKVLSELGGTTANDGEILIQIDDNAIKYLIETGDIDFLHIYRLKIEKNNKYSSNHHIYEGKLFDLKPFEEIQE
jgi:hypothetical protein